MEADKEFAAWLHAACTAKEFTVPGLARRAGLSHSTLHRLEQGTTKPQSNTLNSLFDVLGTPADERRRVWALIHAPRAAREANPEFLRHAGDLIKDMRERSNLTQRDLAQILGVNETLVSHWEYGRAIPTPDLMQRMLDVLNASSEENNELADGDIVLASLASSRLTLDACVQDMYQLIAQIDAGEAIGDGRFYVLEAKLRTLTRRSPAAWGILLATYGWHGEWLIRWSRCPEMDRYANRALSIVQAQTPRDPERWRAVYLMARSAAERDPQSGYKYIRDWEQSITSPADKASLARDAAGYASWAGHYDAAEQLILGGRRILEHLGDTRGIHLNRHVHASICRAAGNAGEARELLGDAVDQCPFQHIQDISLRAHILFDLKLKSEAGDQVRAYQYWTERYGLLHRKHSLDWLAKKL